MINFGSVVVLAAVMELIFAQIIDICDRPPNSPNGEETPDCCQIPPLFTNQDLTKCGILDTMPGDSRSKPGSIRDCPQFKCIAKQYNIVHDGELDLELINNFLNKYVSKNPTFKSAVEVAKKTCVGKPLVDMEKCPPMKLFSCIVTVLLAECPGYRSDPRCHYLTEYLNKCSGTLVADVFLPLS